MLANMVAIISQSNTKTYYPQDDDVRLSAGHPGRGSGLFFCPGQGREPP